VPAALQVLDPGLLALVEDLGRPGLAHLGVGRSSAANRASFRLANRLVGNRERAAALELALGACARAPRAWPMQPGADLKTVQDLLGHVRIVLAADTYWCCTSTAS
jgi:hypothetical protein